MYCHVCHQGGVTPADTHNISITLPPVLCVKWKVYISWKLTTQCNFQQILTVAVGVLALSEWFPVIGRLLHQGGKTPQFWRACLPPAINYIEIKEFTAVGWQMHLSARGRHQSDSCDPTDGSQRRPTWVLSSDWSIHMCLMAALSVQPPKVSWYTKWKLSYSLHPGIFQSKEKGWKKHRTDRNR